MIEISREEAAYYAAKAMVARLVDGAAADIESECSILIPTLTLESRQAIAREMRAIAASVDCEQSQLLLAKHTLAGEVLAVQRAEAGVNLDPIQFPAHLMEGGDRD